jgi:peptide/nickel transport system ATP-binding protein
MSLLEVDNLLVEFTTSDGIVKAVDGVSFKVDRGETLAIVGESGSGKTVTNLAIMGLLPNKIANISGSAKLDTGAGPIDLLTIPSSELRKIRGKDVAMIFQDPMSALHPYYTIGHQIIEAHQIHNQCSEEDSEKRTIELLELVGISDASKRLNAFPHQFSGGMRQRVMIAMALVNNPKVLIADEPTTALDVTVQAQIMKLLADLQKELGMAMILITHDLGVVAGSADRINVMYAGKIVESANVFDLFANPQMPYTHGLLASIPRVDRPQIQRLETIPGQPPSLISLPAGCSFAPRCSRKSEVAGSACDLTMPDLVEIGTGHSSRCHLAGLSGLSGLSGPVNR